MYPKISGTCPFVSHFHHIESVCLPTGFHGIFRIYGSPFPRPSVIFLDNSVTNRYVLSEYGRRRREQYT